jgi:hypothetical protein
VCLFVPKRTIIGVMQSLAKAAVNQALEKAILKAGSSPLPSGSNATPSSRPTHLSPASVSFPGASSANTRPVISQSSLSGSRYGNLSGGGSGDYSADMRTWKALVDHPVVANADSVDTKDLYLISNDM